MTFVTSKNLGRNIAGSVILAFAAISGLAGCEEAREEKVLDVEAPGVDVEINKTEDPDGGGSIEIETHSEDET